MYKKVPLGHTLAEGVITIKRSFMRIDLCIKLMLLSILLVLVIPAILKST